MRDTIVWCWFTGFPAFFCVSLSKEQSQWNEILIKGIRLVHCWTISTPSSYPSGARLKTQSYLKIWCLDTNVICQSKIISPQDQLNACILLSCPFAGLFFFFSRGPCSFAWVISSSCCIGNSCNNLGLQRWIVPENSAIDNLVGFGTAHFTVACSWRLANLHGCNHFHKFNTEAAV